MVARSLGTVDTELAEEEKPTIGIRKLLCFGQSTDLLVRLDKVGFHMVRRLLDLKQ